MSAISSQRVQPSGTPGSCHPSHPPNPNISSLANAPLPSPHEASLSTTTPVITLPESIRGADNFHLSLSITIIPYDPLEEDTYLPAIQSLISGDLSEPYSIYCYRYFLYQWPGLCFLALDNECAPTTTSGAEKNGEVSKTDNSRKSHIIGAVVSKLEQHRNGPMRGYIGMLAVSSSYRSKGIATKLVAMSIDAMIAQGADEIALETEVTNTASLKLYERLGFLRSKRLHRYYLNGSSAFRLILYVKPGTSKIPTVPPPAPFSEDYGEDEEEGLYS